MCVTCCSRVYLLMSLLQREDDNDDDEHCEDSSSKVPFFCLYYSFDKVTAQGKGEEDARQGSGLSDEGRLSDDDAADVMLSLLHCL